ncbi:cytochrome P450 CYP12A2-like [Chironomus tepperi]|uniref:cytochrome P450 CYP12A2-like n=1 Tax=Chironomus tepperi TaxID=113505 RepID=UPI00391F74F2
MRNLIIRQVNSLSRRAYSAYLGSEIENAKPFSEMPTISFLKMVKESIPGGKYYKKSIKEVLQAFNEEFGEAVRIPAMLGNPEVVMSYNSEYFERILRAEGNWPVRTGLDSLEYYRDTKRPEIYKDLGSLFVSHGEKWSSMRSIANPILMQPKTIKKYTTQVDDIAKEFIEVMRKIRNDKSEMPGDFSNYINTWSLESVTAVGLERRLNLFDENTHDENAKKLIKGIRDFFEMTAEYDGKASVWKYYQTKGFKELLNVYDTLTDVILHYIDQAIKEMNESSSSSDAEDSVLRKLLRADKRVAVIVVSDLMLAGVDTTASAVLNTLYCLAKNPEKQEILRQELINILPEKNSKLTTENNKNMPYLRAVIKEAMRLYPVVSGNVRQTTKEIVVSEYRIPANTHVALQFYIDLLNEKYYPDPMKFLPERWLRDQSDGDVKAGVANPFSFLPFGFGVRSCIGKRIAELELETLVVNVIRNFKVEWHYPEMKIKSTFVNIPDSEMRFKVIDV